MSDFLTRLAAKAVGAAPVIQPRLPSLFETGGQSQRPVIEVDAQRETSVIDQPNQTVSPNTNPVTTSDRRRPATNLVGEPRAAINLEAGRQRLDSDSALPHRRERVGESALTETRSAEITAFTPANTEASDKASSPQVVQHERETRSEQTVIQREHESEWPLIQPKIRQLISDQLSEVAITPKANEQFASKPAEPVPSSLPIAAPPQPPQVRPAEILVREPARVSEAQTSINVTIGRVDVRAVFAPVSQPARVAKDVPSRTASLDEYLKKRSGVSR
jgi:hypothetical protein